MRILVLGGTQFLGRHFVEAALGRGHEVTLFNRARTAPELFPDAERLRGDRDGDLDAFADSEWDAVLDTSGFVPRVVQQSAQLLQSRIGRYVFVSSISVYADFSRPGVDEDAPVARLEQETEDYRSQAYGALKALCEETVRETYGGRATIVRPGLIVGPWDPTGRFTYWPARIAAGGVVLAPEPLNALVQLIDARDLAEWCLHLAEADIGGTFNAVGPETPLTMAQVLAECVRVADSEATFIWAAARWLVDQGVQEWMELPLWIASPEFAGHSQVDNSRARAAGLRFRPLGTTIADTLAWVRSGASPPDAPAGLSRHREQELLGLLASGIEDRR